jgi:crotonobetainyl-CoA:carnitine CoA-transferase CaiB-like acyl-CoA transferase
MIGHPQIAAAGIVVESDHPVAGRVRQTRNAARFSATPPEHRRGAPLLGEHTIEVLREAGYGDSDIAALRKTALGAPSLPPEGEGGAQRRKGDVGTAAAHSR